MSRLSAAAPKKGPYHHGNLKNALIEAGVDLLSKEGVAGLSLRRVAQKAGVSRTAPYAHFADKQALIAAISTEGYSRLFDAFRRVAERHEGNPGAKLVEGAWAYLKFALDDPDHFKVTTSGAVEREKDYPSFVEMSEKCFSLVLRIVEECQARGVLRPGPSDLVAVSVWSLMHGLISLVLENQIPHALRDRLSIRELLVSALNQITLIELRDPAPQRRR
ncbi:MAG TPA: TetR/AcrR family transcriptional regulator [Polyangiaceae bacterium]|nr:TetR/AcrR family transcriptional regulator [Polyangiaceae bacterium]